LAKSYDFGSALDALINQDGPITAGMIYGLSDLNEESLNTLRARWGGIPVERRRDLVKRLTETSESDFEMDFSAVARLALTDLDDQVREEAIEAVWLDESPVLATQLIAMASGDISPSVRAAAASALGRFILLGETEHFDPAIARRAQNMMLQLYRDKRQPVAVRRRALESIANCGREGVEEMITEAYKHEHPEMRYGAIFAMGRTCDPKWRPIILRELESDEPEMRYEAVRSAGELELREAVPLLGRIVRERDRELKEMAIWSLGEIGGNEAVHILEELMEVADKKGDDELSEAIEEALESATLAGYDLGV